VTKVSSDPSLTPGNIQRPAEIVGETVDAVTIRLEGTTMVIARHSEQPIERAFVDHTLIGGSTLFPRDQIASYARRRSIRSRHGCCWNGAMLPAASCASWISASFVASPCWS